MPQGHWPYSIYEIDATKVPSQRDTLRETKKNPSKEESPGQQIAPTREARP